MTKSFTLASVASLFLILASEIAWLVEVITKARVGEDGDWVCLTL